jgi:hypothetical protein
MKNAHFPTVVLAAVLLLGSMAFAQAAGAGGEGAGGGAAGGVGTSSGAMSAPSAGVRTGIGTSPGLTSPTAPTGRTTTQIPTGLQPCRTGQTSNCTNEMPEANNPSLGTGPLGKEPYGFGQNNQPEGLELGNGTVR